MENPDFHCFQFLLISIYDLLQTQFLGPFFVHIRHRFAKHWERLNFMTDDKSILSRKNDKDSQLPEPHSLHERMVYIEDHFRWQS